MSANKLQLKCHVQKGMFDDEYLVVMNVIDKEGEQIEAAAFVNKDELHLPVLPEGDNVVDGLLTVSFMGATRKTVSIVLPKSTLANGPVVLVEKSDLIPSEEAVAL